MAWLEFFIHNTGGCDLPVALPTRWVIKYMSMWRIVGASLLLNLSQMSLVVHATHELCKEGTVENTIPADLGWHNTNTQ